MLMVKFKFVFTYVIILLCLGSCFKKEEFITSTYQDIEQGWGVPLIDSKLELRDIIAVIDPNLGIREEADNSYSFYYYDTIYSPFAEDLFILPDQSTRFSRRLSIPQPVVVAPGVQVKDSVTFTESFDIALGNQLKRIELKGGNLSLNLASSFRHNITLRLSIPSLLTSAQQVFTRTYQLAPGGGITENLALGGYTLNLTSASNQGNSLSYSLNYTITSSGQPISPGDSIEFSTQLQNLRYRLIVGNIGSLAIPNSAGNLNVNVFDQATLGNLFFAQAKLKLGFDNSFGIPVTFTINRLRSSTYYGKSVDITAENPRFTIPIAAPALPQQGSAARTNIVLDNSNSRIVEAVNPAPNNLEYNFNSSITPGTDNFILDRSQVKVYAEIQIPINGYISAYEIKDTTTLRDLPERSYKENNVEGILDSAIFKIKIDNYLPAIAFTQIYFLDRNFQVLDSLLLQPDNFIASNFVDPVSGVATTPTIKETFVSMNGTRYDKLSANARYIYLYSRVTTPINPVDKKPINIKLLSGNSLRVVIAVMTKGRIKIQSL